jgi:hypothetical protein
LTGFDIDCSLGHSLCAAKKTFEIDTVHRLSFNGSPNRTAVRHPRRRDLNHFLFHQLPQFPNVLLVLCRNKIEEKRSKSRRFRKVPRALRLGENDVKGIP